MFHMSKQQDPGVSFGLCQQEHGCKTEVKVRLSSVLDRSHLEHCVQFCPLRFIKRSGEVREGTEVGDENGKGVERQSCLQRS